MYTCKNVGCVNRFLQDLMIFGKTARVRAGERVILRKRVGEMSLGGTHFALAGLWQSIGLALGCRDLRRQAPL